MDTVKMDPSCPVCGFALGFEPWVADSPSDEICPCCHIQFGYHDCAGKSLDQRMQIYRRWRANWVADGMPWRGAASPPPDWSATRQLLRIDDQDIGGG